MSVPVPCPTEHLDTNEISALASRRDGEVPATPSLKPRQTRKLEGWLVLLVVIITSALFWKVLKNDFLLWDDDINITDNVNLGPLTGERLQWMFTDSSYVRRYMPFGWLTWCAIYGFAGLSSFAFHAANLLFHLLNTALIFVFLRQLPGLKDEPEDTRSRRLSRSVCAAAGTLFWALHPMRVESVAWASSLIYAQALCCLLIAWLCFLKIQTDPAGGRKRWVLQLTSLAAYCVSLLTYPIGLGAVAVFLVVSLLPSLERTGRGWELRTGWWRGSLRQTSPYVLVAALVLGTTLFASSHASGLWQPPRTLAEFDLLSRVMQVFYMLGHYVWKPWLPMNLCAVYTTLVHFDPLSLPFILHALLVIGITLLLVKKARRWPFVLALWFCYLALLVPVSGPTIHPHFPSDRYSYIAGLIWSVLLAVLLRRAWERRGFWRIPAITTAVAVLLGCALLTSNYLDVWRDSGTFFRYNARRIEHAHHRMHALSRLGTWHGNRGDWEAAKAAFREGLLIKPNDLDLNNSYGIALGATGQKEAAERQFELVLKLNPQNAVAHQYLGVLAKERGNPETYRDTADRLPEQQAGK